MYFKTLLIVCLALLVSCSLNAQRVGEEAVTITYYELPDQPFPTDYTTYSASVNILGNQKLNELKPAVTSQSLTEKYLQLESFRQLIAGGHFHVNIQIGRLKIDRTEPHEYKTTVEKDSVKTTKISYTKKIWYRYPITLQVFDTDGEVVLRQVENNPVKGLEYEFTKKTASTFATIKEMETSWNKKKEERLNEERSRLIANTFYKYRELLQEAFDAKVATEKIKIQLPKGKKVPNVDAHKTNVETAVRILGSMTAEGDITPLQEQMAPVLAFWSSQLELLPTDDKRLGKVHYACLYNLCLVNIHLEQFEEARTYLQACQEFDGNKRSTEELATTLTNIENSLDENGRPSRHFKLDLSSATGPDVDYTEYFRVAGLRDKSVQHTGYMVTSDGDSLRGHFVFSDGDFREPSFYENGNTIFVYEEGSDTRSRLFDPDEIVAAGFQGRTFTTIDYTPGLALTSKMNIMEVLEGGPKLNLYRYYPFRVRENTETEPDTKLVIHKTGEKPESMGMLNLSFANWSKSFAAYFADCEALYAEVRVGEYRRNERRMKEAIRVYNNNDCE